MTEKIPCVYILANKRNATLYTGVTACLYKRLEEHRSGAVDGFTKKFKVYMLVYYVYYEVFEDMYAAIKREKQIKGDSQKKEIGAYREKQYAVARPVHRGLILDCFVEYSSKRQKKEKLYRSSLPPSLLCSARRAIRSFAK